MKYAQHLALFRCRVIKNVTRFKVVLDPVTIEFRPGPISFPVIVQDARINVLGHGGNLAHADILEVPAGDSYLSLIARSESLDQDSVVRMEQAIDRTIAQFSMLFAPQMFMEPVFRGPLKGEKMVLSLFVRPALSQVVEVGELKKNLEKMGATLKQDSEHARRFDLMSRFYSKALSFDPGEEQFLMLWTALEIHPMVNTSNIRPLVDLMSRVSGESKEKVNELFQIGRLFGIRSDLVHDGVLPIKEYRDSIRRAELMVHEAMRDLLGLPYGNALSLLAESRRADG